MGCIIFLLNTANFFPKEIFAYREKVFFEYNIDHTSPTLSLYKVLFDDYTPIVSNDLSSEEILELRKYGFYFNPKSTYPLVKDFVYTEQPPFHLINKNTGPPNIIVFFTEGYSARTMTPYGSKLENITPHLDAFSTQSMVVENYYNHSAATYRGLLGQLCSLYPFYGGVGGWATNYNELPERNYLCLNQVFSKNGYETFFFDSHRKDNAYVDELALKLGFDQVLTAEELSVDYLQGIEPARSEALSDGQFYESLANFLKQRLKTTEKKPFFVCLYNFGTHAFVDVVDPRSKRYGDGQNHSLNTIHNLDHAFGTFWSYFKSSKYAKNTIIIFTADHAHLAEKSFADVIKDKNYHRLMIDKIPLIIYDAARKLPAKYRNYSKSVGEGHSSFRIVSYENH